MTLRWDKLEKFYLMRLVIFRLANKYPDKHTSIQHNIIVNYKDIKYFNMFHKKYPKQFSNKNFSINFGFGIYSNQDL